MFWVASHSPNTVIKKKIQLLKLTNIWIVGKNYNNVLHQEIDFEQEMKKYRLINDKETRFARYGYNFAEKLIRKGGNIFTLAIFTTNLNFTLIDMYCKNH